MHGWPRLHSHNESKWSVVKGVVSEVVEQSLRLMNCCSLEKEEEVPYMLLPDNKSHHMQHMIAHLPFQSGETHMFKLKGEQVVSEVAWESI